MSELWMLSISVTLLALALVKFKRSFPMVKVVDGGERIEGLVLAEKFSQAKGSIELNLYGGFDPPAGETWVYVNVKLPVGHPEAARLARCVLDRAKFRVRLERVR